jgi:hypothetical protein
MRLPRSPKQLAQLISTCLREEFVTGAIRAGESGYAVGKPEYEPGLREYLVEVSFYTPEMDEGLPTGRSRVLWRATVYVDSKMGIYERHRKNTPTEDVERIHAVMDGCE